ncbi:MAG: insulinase family protein [Acidobacteria bacterium]|nr:insulinase family protein [Acidobacteriota bacterium]
MKRIMTAAAPLVLLACLTAGLGALTPDEVRQHDLPNGLKVLLVPRHNIPSVALYTFFRVGSRNERVGLTGVSHFIEHMMFNGSKNVPPGEFDRIMEFHGGSNNAYTGDDMTAYTDWFPPEALEPMIRIEADRMQGLRFDPKVLESERSVVANERRLTTENDNRSLLNEHLRATAIMAHPYHWDVIGWMSDILSWRRDEIVAYYRTYYAPNNAVLILVGDFDPARAIGLIRKHFGAIRRVPPPPPVSTVEPPQMGIRRVVVRKQSQAPLLMLAFRGVACTDKDFPALQALESALLDGESSRLYRRLVWQEQSALSVRGGIEENLDPYLFTIVVQPKPGADLALVERQVLEEIEKVRTDGVSEREVQKAVNGIRSAHYRRLQSQADIANALGRAELLHGDWKKLFDFSARYDKLGPEAVRGAAARYLVEDALTVGTLIPKEN